MKAVIILSGGMDSTTLAYDIASKGQYDEIHAVSFDYGQKHKKELDCARVTALKLGFKCHHVVDLSSLGDILQSALTSDIEVPEGDYDDENQKLTVVPNRNMIMLSIAAGYAMSIGAEDLYYGAHANDACIPGDEVIITSTGKVMMNDLNIGDMVLSYDTKNRVTSFQPVTNKICNGYRDDMLCISVKGGKSIKLTSNHKVFRVDRSNFDHRFGWEKTIVEVPASDIKVDDWVIMPVVGYPVVSVDTPVVQIDLLQFCDKTHMYLRYDDTHVWFKANNKVNRFVDSKSFVKLLAWYTTEGCAAGPSQSNTYRISIAQSKDENPKYCNEIYELLSTWGFKWSHSGHSIEFSGPTTRVFNICGNGSHNKHIPHEYMMMHPLDWIDTLMKGDGYIDGDMYITSSYELKEQFSYLAVVLGYSCSTSVSYMDVYNINFNRCPLKKMNNIGGAKISQVRSISHIKGDLVYDITVENNHNFFAGEGAGILVSNSIYPDCRPVFVEKMNDVFKVSHYTPVRLLVPYLYYGKANIAARGMQLKVPYEDSWTCYKGGEKPCGKCGSCNERLMAFREISKVDPLEYME